MREIAGKAKLLKSDSGFSLEFAELLQPLEVANALPESVGIAVGRVVRVNGLIHLSAQTIQDLRVDVTDLALPPHDQEEYTATPALIAVQGFLGQDAKQSSAATSASIAFPPGSDHPTWLNISILNIFSLSSQLTKLKKGAGILVFGQLQQYYSQQDKTKLRCSIEPLGISELTSGRAQPQSLFSANREAEGAITTGAGTTGASTNGADADVVEAFSA